MKLIVVDSLVPQSNRLRCQTLQEANFLIRSFNFNILIFVQSLSQRSYTAFRSLRQAMHTEEVQLREKNLTVAENVKLLELQTSMPSFTS